jgi:hypothetical protein
MNYKNYAFPGFEGVNLANEELVRLVVETGSWPKSRVALENLLYNSYLHKFNDEFQGKILKQLGTHEEGDEVYTAPHKRDMPGPKEQEASLEDAVPYLGFIDLQDKNLIELVIKTGSWSKNVIALENLLYNAKKLGLGEEYTSKVEEALKTTPITSYTTPEQHSENYTRGKDKVETSLDRALDKKYESYEELRLYDQKLVTSVIETKSWHNSQAALKSLLDSATALGLDEKYTSKVQTALDAYDTSTTQHTSSGRLSCSTDYAPEDGLDRALNAPFATEIIVADAKLTVLVVKTASLPKSLTALDSYLKTIAKLKEGTILEFNSKKPGEKFTLPVTKELKEKLTQNVLDKADEIIPKDINGLAKCFDKLIASRTSGVIKEKVLDEIDSALPRTARELAATLKLMDKWEFSPQMKQLVVEKAENYSTISSLKSALGNKAYLLDEIKEDNSPTWQAPKAKSNSPGSPGHKVDRMNEKYKDDSAHSKTMTARVVTDFGDFAVITRERIGHDGESQATLRYMKEHGLPHWKSALTTKIPTLDKLSDVEVKNLTALTQTISSTKKWPGGNNVIENLLVQVMHFLPHQTETMLNALPLEWTQNIGNMVSLFGRIKALINDKPDEEVIGSYLSSEIADFEGRGNTMIAELYCFTKNHFSKGGAKDALLEKMEALLPSLDEDEDSLVSSENIIYEVSHPKPSVVADYSPAGYMRGGEVDDEGYVIAEREVSEVALYGNSVFYDEDTNNNATTATTLPEQENPVSLEDSDYGDEEDADLGECINTSSLDAATPEVNNAAVITLDNQEVVRKLSLEDSDYGDEEDRDDEFPVPEPDVDVQALWGKLQGAQTGDIVVDSSTLKKMIAQIVHGKNSCSDSGVDSFRNSILSDSGFVEDKSCGHEERTDALGAHLQFIAFGACE